MKQDNMVSLRGLLEKMETDQLDEMLDKELHSKHVDEEAVRIILSILREREKNVHVTLTPEIEAAWKQYQENTTGQKQKRLYLSPISTWAVRAATIAVVCSLLISIIPREAGAKNFWDRLVRLTNEIIEFFGSSENEDRLVEYVFQTENPGLQQVYETVVEQGITEPIVPMWLPEGYQLTHIEVQNIQRQTIIYSCFQDNNREITYQIHIYDTDVPNKFQKDEKSLKEIEQDGTTYYILRNNDMWCILWTKGNIECSIFADCQEEVLNQIISSI